MKLPPLCHYCGKPIAKKTETHYVRLRSEGGFSSDAIIVEQDLRSKEECQRLTNHTVVSVTYSDDKEWKKPTDPGYRGRHVWKFSTWDRETYVDNYFCNADHARFFGYLMAKGGHCTVAYNNALEAQKRGS